MAVRMISPFSPAVRGEDLLAKVTRSVSGFCMGVDAAKYRPRVGHVPRNWLLIQPTLKRWLSTCSFSISTVSSQVKDGASLDFLRNKKIVPEADPPNAKDVDLLCQFFSQSNKLTVLTGAGTSTESGIPDYRSPNGAYSSGFKPITHQQFVHSSRARKRYWARSYAGWRRFTAAEPSAGHMALSTLEKAGRVHFMITQNVDRLHHRAGSNPLELHGTVYVVSCLECGNSIDRELFQDQVKDLNPKDKILGSWFHMESCGSVYAGKYWIDREEIRKMLLQKWALALDSLKHDSPGSDKDFGMQQRPDGDIEIDEKFWEADFNIPNCQKCNGLLKPDVVFFGDNVPKERAVKAMEAAKDCDSFLVLGSSLMTMSAFRLARAAHEVGAAVAIINIGDTRADDFASLKINARCGEILPRAIEVGCLALPNI